MSAAPGGYGRSWNNTTAYPQAQVTQNAKYDRSVLAAAQKMKAKQGEDGTTVIEFYKWAVANELTLDIKQGERCFQRAKADACI